jgi:hypothetical protein
MAVLAQTWAEQGAGSPLWCLSTRDSASHRAVSDLRRTRFIVPVQRKLASLGLATFLPAGKRLAMQAMESLTMRSSPAPAWLRETELLHELKHVVGNPQAVTIARIGTPGPYTKNTVLFMGPEGEPLAIAKVGTTDAAAALLCNEARWLQRMAQTPLAVQVPGLLQITERASACVLLESAGVGEPGGGRRPQPEHIHFLAQLQQVAASRPAFDGSRMQSALHQGVASLHGKLSDPWRRRATDTLTVIERELGSAPVPMVAAHRDFAGWNMLETADRLLVFDWEFAREEYAPLYDLLHYHLMPIAVRKDVSVGRARSALRSVMAEAASLPEGALKCHGAAAQMLAYLLDVCLFYLESNDGDDRGDMVVLRYGKLIDRFGDWSSLS